MKKNLTLRLFASLFFIFLGFASQAQQLHYVVIGSFAHENNAEKFAGYARSQNFFAQYDLCAEAKLFYVYVLKTPNQQDAANRARSLRQESEFKETWVYNGALEKDKQTIAATDTPAAPGATEPEPAAVVAVPVETVPSEEVVSAASEGAEDSRHFVVVDSTTVKPIPADALGKIKTRGKLFKFVVATPDGQPVPATVHYIDYNRGRDLATYPVNQYLDILPPLSLRKEPMTLVCAVFGYKEVIHQVEYAAPYVMPEITEDDKGAWVVPFRLEPLSKGDVSVMYHVSFYKDAVIMLPLAKVELDQLAQMMSANPNYKIKVHGHSNGSNSRRIIALGPSKNYFNVEGSEEHTGSAKELSRLRAEAVRQYLTDHGISKSRIDIHAWGSQDMLVPETSNNAKLNDRVEIEFLKD
jgi:outer membrane protein OmpA-like peptidoglycan-associated protein